MILPTIHCKETTYMSPLSYIVKRCKLHFIFCFLHFTAITAQIYPVQVTPQIIPPYSFQLSDYATTTQEKLFVNLLLTDAQEFGRQVGLKLFVEGPGINFQSTDFVSGTLPIVLDGGINNRLTNLDLQAYFSYNNLVGISPQQYGQQLPEGQYRFCFEVYDQFSGQRISNRSCANIYLVLNDPPLLNVPFRGDLVTAQNLQNIIFNWTPRHINAGAVQYEFTLKELWDTAMDPQAAFLASPPLYQTTTFANTLHYGPAQTPLLEGKTYGWQVRAFVSDGINDTSLFRNNGLSEIYHFTYRADCPPPRFVLSEAQNSQIVKITWQMGEHLRYRVQYRKKGYGEDDWFGQWSQTNGTTIRNLEAGTIYEFRVGGECTPNGGLAYSPIHEFTTPTEDEVAYYNCGIPPEIEIANQEPLLNLGVNEVFTAGDFPVTVVEVQGSNGRFSGQGFITVPYLADTKIAVGFEDITVNTDYQLIEGMVETEYDPSWGSIGGLDQFISDLGKLMSLLGDAIDELQELIRRKEEGNITQDEFEEGWSTQTKILEESAALMDANPKIPEAMRKEVNRTVGNKFLASTNNEIPSTSGDLDTAKRDLDKLEEINEILEKIKNSKKLIVTIYEVDIATGGHDKKHTEEHYDHIFEHEDTNKVNAATYIYKEKADYGDPYFEFEKVGRVREILKSDLPSNYLEDSNTYVHEFDFRGQRYNAINHKNYYQSGTAFMKVLAENPVDAAVWNMLWDIKTEKQQRILGNVVQITGGVIAIVAAAPSGGGSISYFAMLEVSAGTAASVSGGLKLYYNAGGNFAQADNIPNGLGGSLGKLIGYSMGYEKEGEQMGEFIEAIVFGYKSYDDTKALWKNFRESKNWTLGKKETLRMIDNFIDLYQLVNESLDLRELRKEVEEE